MRRGAAQRHFVEYITIFFLNNVPNVQHRLRFLPLPRTEKPQDSGRWTSIDGGAFMYIISDLQIKNRLTLHYMNIYIYIYKYMCETYAICFVKVLIFYMYVVAVWFT